MHFLLRLRGLLIYDACLFLLPCLYPALPSLQEDPPGQEWAMSIPGLAGPIIGNPIVPAESVLRAVNVREPPVRLPVLQFKGIEHREYVVMGPGHHGLGQHGAVELVVEVGWADHTKAAIAVEGPGELG